MTLNSIPAIRQSVVPRGRDLQLLAQSWDVAAAFEDGWTTKSNPYGMWSYGYSSGFTAPVTLYDRAEQNGVNGPNAQFWFSSAVDLANSRQWSSITDPPITKAIPIYCQMSSLL